MMLNHLEINSQMKEQQIRCKQVTLRISKFSSITFISLIVYQAWNPWRNRIQCSTLSIMDNRLTGSNLWTHIIKSMILAITNTMGIQMQIKSLFNNRNSEIWLDWKMVIWSLKECLKSVWINLTILPDYKAPIPKTIKIALHRKTSQ